MDTLVPVGLLALCVVVFVIWPLYRRREARQATGAWQRDALLLGLMPHDNLERLAEQLREFDLARVRLTGGVIGEKLGVQIQPCVFRFTKRNDRSGKDVYATAVLIDLPSPKLRIGRIDEHVNPQSAGKDLLRQVAGAVMPQHMLPVTFSDDPGFEKKYGVSGPDHDAIRNFFSPEVRSRFALDYDTSLLGNGKRLLWLLEHAIAQSEDFPRLLEQVEQIIAAIRGPRP
ncbi:MAG: hypothetical protein AAF654_14615 [Myxococcota bacterium]